MTNEEAYNIISEFCFTGYEDNKKPSFKLFGAIHELILDVEENTKLKAEIERLKSELEKAVKLPCRFSDALFGYCSAFGQILEYGLDSVITDEIETIYCISAWSRAIGEYPTECLDELEIQYSDFGKTIFLSREEAERALKGQV